MTYLQSVSKEFLFKYCACSYFKNVEAKIIEEMDKIKLEFDVQTRIDEYVNIIKTELIIKNMKTIVEMENCGVVYMLRNNQHDELKWMYNFLSSVNGGVKVMFDGMRPYFREVGESVVRGTRKMYDFNTCVQSLLDLKTKFDNLMVNLFNNDPLFDETVGDEFNYFLNLNSFIPNYLSFFIDEKLRRGTCTYIKNNPEADINKVIYMIKYLKKKKKFESSYQKYLCNRLLHCKFFSLDSENKMISKLNSTYTNGNGTLFISKLYGMIRDKFVLSEHVMTDYNAYVEINKCIFGISKSFDFDIDVLVINSVNWPVDRKSKHEIPSFGLCAFNEFKTIYQKNTQDNAKKKLMLLPQFGTVELNAHFYGKPCLDTQLDNELPKTNIERVNRKLKLEVTTYQMCVLDLFNTNNTLTFKEIQSKTKIPRTDLIKSLQDMMQFGNNLRNLLIKTPRTREINMTDIFCINESFEYIEM
ncbi:cullin-3-like [Acyrthosiphon pisum]|uniref:Cullin family profile domain-containing protein n=1 Tax=Acyrthosiphon pisum TaxID=7029 RepID=A0A8R2JLW1_ACYPI|nr:cullin-3-like [Acyrthosiphon pisum]